MGSSITVSPLVETKYTVIPVGTCLINSDTVEINISELISLDVDLSVDVNDVCMGEEQTFTAVVTNSADGSPFTDGATFTWEVNGVEEQSNLSNEFISSSLSNLDEVRITVIPATITCLDPINYNPSNRIIIADIKPLVTPTISITGDTVLCAGIAGDFTADITNEGISPNIEWFVNNISRGSTDMITLSSLNDGDIIRSTLTSSEECAVVAESNELSIEISTNLPFDLILNPYEACIEDVIDLSVASNMNSSNLTFEWYVNGEAVGNNSNIYSYIPSQGDIVSVGASTDLICAAVDTANTQEEELLFGGLVTADAGGERSIELPDDIILDGSNSDNATSFIWSELIGGSTDFIADDRLATVFSDEVGVRVFELEAGNGFCPTDKDTLVVTITGPDDILVPNAFTPNGDENNDALLILNSEVFRDIEVMIYNRWGSRVFSALNGYSVENAWDGTFKGRELPEGAYYYVIKFNRGTKQKNGVVNLIR